MSYAHNLVSEERERERKIGRGQRDIPTDFHEIPGVFPWLKVDQLGSKKLDMRLGEWPCCVPCCAAVPKTSFTGKDHPPTSSCHF